MRTVETVRREIAFTFDDGPSRWTEPLLDSFAAHGGRATFFVLGESVAGHEATLERVVQEGHEVGNHTFSHPRLTTLNEEDISREIRSTSELIEGLSGAPVQFWRPPFFDFDRRVCEAVAASGLPRMVHCTVPTGDYASSVALICARIRAGAKPGAIVDLHDGAPKSQTTDGVPPSRRSTIAAVEAMLPYLAEQGYRFVTISELLDSS